MNAGFFRSGHHGDRRVMPTSSLLVGEVLLVDAKQHGEDFAGLKKGTEPRAGGRAVVQATQEVRADDDDLEPGVR